MAKAKSTGGWFKESLRHRQARMLGKASPSSRVQTLLKKHPSYKDMTFKALQKKGVFLKYKGDADKDGVANVNDCRPLNKYAQDNGLPADMYNKEGKLDQKKYQEYLNKQANKKYDYLMARIADINVNDADYQRQVFKEINAEKTLTEDQYTKLLHQYNQFKPNEAFEKKEPTGADEDGTETREKEPKKTFGEKTKELYEAGKEKASELKKAYNEMQEEKKEKKLDRLEDELETIESVDDETRERLSTMDLKDLTDKELKQLAITEEEGLFGGNPYKEELVRRITNEARVEADLMIARREGKKEAKERLKEAEGGSGDSIFPSFKEIFG